MKIVIKIFQRSQISSSAPFFVNSRIPSTGTKNCKELKRSGEKKMVKDDYPEGEVFCPICQKQLFRQNF